MPRKKGGPTREDYVECMDCSERLQRRTTQSHWSVKRHPKNIPDDERFYELQNPRDKYSDIVAPSSDHSDDDDDECKDIINCMAEIR